MYSTTVELEDTKRSGWLGVGMMQPPPGAGIMYHVCTAPIDSPLDPCEALRYIGVEAPQLIHSFSYPQHPLNNYYNNYYNYNRYTNTRLNPI